MNKNKESNRIDDRQCFVVVFLIAETFELVREAVVAASDMSVVLGAIHPQCIHLLSHFLFSSPTLQQRKRKDYYRLHLLFNFLFHFFPLCFTSKLLVLRMADVLPEPAARQKTAVDNDKLQPKLPSVLKMESVSSSGAERDSTASSFTLGYSVEHSATDWHLHRLWSVAERALVLLWCTAATMIYFDFSVCGRLLRSPTTDA